MNFKILLCFILNFCVGYTQNKPNVIWLVCEDQSPEFFSIYGNTSVNLPNIEALRADSVMYNNFYSPSAVCSPSRSAIITGMYPTTIGTHNMRAYNEGRKSNQPQLKIPSYSPKFPSKIKPFTITLRNAGYYCINSGKEDYNFKISNDAWDKTCSYCQGKEKSSIHWRYRAKNQPFFAVFNFQITHEAQIWHQAKKSILVDIDKVKVPPIFPNDSITRKDLAINYSNLIRMDKQLGKIIQQLKDDGLYESSYIFFYSDHGGPFPRYKRAIYETGTKVPFVVKFPNNKYANTTNNDLLSFIDLAPTMLNIAELKIPRYIQGHSFINSPGYKPRKLLFTATDRFDGQFDRIRAVRSRRYKLIRNYELTKPHALDVNYRNQMPLMRHLMHLVSLKQLNESQSLWFQVPKSNFEFYDLINDPYEINNLINNEAYIDDIRYLKQALNSWIRKTKDKGEIDEYDLIKSAYIK